MMSIPLDPKRTFDVVLKTDRSKPKNRQPAFVFRYLTVGEFQCVLSCVTAADTCDDIRQMMSQWVEPLKIGIVNWKHMGCAFDADGLADLITFGEARELMEAMINHAIPDDSDLGRIRLAAMMRCGVICRLCIADKCVDMPNADEPLELRCMACDGKGCDDCDDGWIVIRGCPKRCVGVDAAEFTAFAELFWRHGNLPVAGGMLDQAKAFWDAATFYRDECAQNGQYIDQTMTLKL